MKLPKGSMVIVGFLIAGLAVLAGGEIWMITGSLLFGLMVSGVVGAFLVWFIRGLIYPSRVRRRFLGEVHEGISEDDFRHPVNAADIARERVERKVKTQPRDIAGSVRSMLVKDKRFEE